MFNAILGSPAGDQRRKASRALLITLLGLAVAFIWQAPIARAQQGASPEVSAKADPVRTPFVPAGVRRASAPSGHSALEAALPEAREGEETAHRPGPATQPPAALGLASTDSPEGYSVGPGDVIHIEVWQEHDASGDFKVGAAGTIHHYLVGDVGVAGHTTGEIARVIREALMLGYLVDPRVSVNVIDYEASKVFIHGEVTRPGVYALRGPTDLLKLLVDAGGPTRDAGNECTLLKIEEGAEGEAVRASTVMLDALLVRGDLSQNKPVSSGDVIFVHPRDESSGQAFGEDERSYFVLGEVKNPGAYRYKEGASAMMAILEAGGFSDFARTNKTKLVREKDGGKEEQIVKMGDVMQKGDRSLDVKLQPGDVLVVPKSLF